MKLKQSCAAFALAAAALAIQPAAFAQDHHDPHDDHHAGYVKHSEWKKGYHMPAGDWGRGERVDWHAHHLRQPPNGYEWRQIDGNFVLAAVATGVVASVIMASN